MPLVWARLSQRHFMIRFNLGIHIFFLKQRLKQMHSLSRCMQFSFILPTKLSDTQGSWIVVCIYSGIAQKEEFVLCFGIKVSVSLREAMFTFWVRCLCCRTPVVYTFHVHIPVFQFNNSFSVVHPTSCKILRLLFWMFLFSVHTIRRRTCILLFRWGGDTCSNEMGFL